MDDKGRIFRVSGPVVVAEGLAGPKMYNVVKVGEEELVGEIIKLNSGRATIQVYEDTSGLRPGAPVEDTGTQLSVSLGPGLLGSIFDGIQRPLDKIKAKSGDFISRGVNVDPIDLKKKWEFTPTVKEGDKVNPGDIIGEVKETSLITHRVIVPQGVSGPIKQISGGKYNLTDSIAEIGGGGAITLMQKWPVRMARPVRDKLPPDVPLITGQRVIDTFFPVAKGGTAAVPGPFGSGKCVTGDTRVLLNDGTLTTIAELYNKKSINGRVTNKGTEEFVEVDERIGLFSLRQNRLIESNSSLLYKGKSDSVLRIRTRTGREVKVTPVHKLFAINDHGRIVETPARELKVGDFIASARKLDMDGSENVALPTQEAIRRTHTKITVPTIMTPELAEFIGYYISEGYIRGKNTVVFTNSEEKLLDRLVALSKRLFGLDGKKEYQKGKTPNVLLMSKTLASFLNSLSCGSAAAEKSMPQQIMQSDAKTVSAFLGSYFAGSGSFYDGNVEFCTASNTLQVQLSYLLTRFGVVHFLAKKLVNGEPYYRIFVRGIGNLKLLLNALQADHQKVNAIISYVNSKTTTYSSVDVVPISSAYISELYNEHGSYSRLLKDGIEISNYATNGEKMGAEVFKKFVKSINVVVGDQIQTLAVQELAEALDYIYCDEIIAIEELNGPVDVYDLSVPDYGCNFVGGFGGLILHNTVIQHQLAKWSDSEIVVYVGCGERGNEMTEILTTFPELADPKSGKPIMDRTVLIANTSNMPVAAREASIYTGITLAEYYRDMGYNVALMADSTSRWAEALREISGRLEEMPGEEGYPAYLGRKVAEFYERAGRVHVLNGAVGSVTAIGAVSPPGGDTSEPVSQNTLRVTRVFWALDAALANRRHFPSINWLNSYSLYLDDLSKWYEGNIDKEWNRMRAAAMAVLQKEAEINEVVQLVGYDALPEKEKEVLDIAKVIREDYLQQSAFDEVDTYSSMKKQYLMLKSIIMLDDAEKSAVDKGTAVEKLQKTDAKQKLARMKFIKEDEIVRYYEDLKKSIGRVTSIEAKQEE